MVLLLVFMQLTRDLFAIAKFLFILFNYKILSRFVALIYFVMNEKIKNPKRILILYVTYSVPSTTLKQKPSLPTPKVWAPTKAHVTIKSGIYHRI